ncbi:MAG: Rrf2 family transcriptional regulator [Lachnospiraceae bacterium]|nr:Rrf2 family transcriptional regulator [Lachnospiraceae bacterium]
MKLSTKARYGLRAFIDVAVYGDEGPISLASIAARQGISADYLEKLMGKLRGAGLVESVRGAAGGYVLTRDVDEYSVGEVLRALEGELIPVDCRKDGKSGCSGTRKCLSHIVWQQINESLNATVDAINIGALIRANSQRNEV